MPKVKVQVAPTNGLAEVAGHPHTAAAGIIETYTDPKAGTFQGVNHPVRFSGQSRGIDRPPPPLGERAEAVLQELGLSGDRIERLRSRAVIG